MIASRPRLVALALAASVAVGLVTASPVLAQERARRVVLTPETDYWFRGLTGAEVPASDVAAGCVGFVSTTPDLILEIDSGIWAHLRVDVADEADTTLVVRSTGGSLCNDDADSLTVNPEIVTYLAPGEYNVYVGVKEQHLRSRYRLRVAEASENNFPTVRRDRPLRLQGVSGGGFQASERAPSCVGAIAGRPNHVVRLEQPEVLFISAESSSDLTLVVVGPDGAVHCSDDARQTLDPRVLQHFSEGLIRIYVGSHNAAVNAYYSLAIEPVTSG